jgi:ABC-2 type transport system permease protein
MSRIHGYRELLEKEVVEAWRTYRLALTCALFVVVGIAAPVMTRFLPELTREVGPDGEIGLPEMGVADVVDVLIRNLVLSGALVALLLAMGSVAGERERGTAAPILVRPVGRGVYLLAKLVALAMILALGTGLGVLAGWLYTALLFGSLPILPWLQAWIVVWLATMVFASITLAGSAAAGSVLGAAAIGVAALVLLTLASEASVLGPWLPTGLSDVARALALEESSTDLDPPRTIAVAAGLIVASFGLAAWRFGREDL